jgi:hypothetical protein
MMLKGKPIDTARVNASLEPSMTFGLKNAPFTIRGISHIV